MKFTIAIPAYKAKYLRECLVSVLSQSYEDFEVIILNDKSPENLREIIDDFDDHRIRYYENDKNIGALNLVDNWNKCLDLAEGEFIICMGDDDKLLPHCLSEYLKLMEKYPDLDVYHGWTEIIDENSEFVRLQEARPEIESVYSMMWHRWNGRHQFIGDFLFRTEILKSIGGYFKLPLAWASDDITSFLMAEEKGIANTQVLVFQYRVNSLTISSTANAEDKMCAVDLQEQWYHRFLEKGAESDIDRKFRTMLQNDLKKYFMKTRIVRAKIDLSKSPFTRLSFWLRRRHRFKMTRPMILKAFLEALPIYYKMVK